MGSVTDIIRDKSSDLNKDIDISKLLNNTSIDSSTSDNTPSNTLDNTSEDTLSNNQRGFINTFKENKLSSTDMSNDPNKINIAEILNATPIDESIEIIDNTKEDFMAISMTRQSVLDIRSNNVYDDLPDLQKTLAKELVNSLLKGSGNCTT